MQAYPKKGSSSAPFRALERPHLVSVRIIQAFLSVSYLFFFGFVQCQKCPHDLRQRVVHPCKEVCENSYVKIYACAFVIPHGNGVTLLLVVPWQNGEQVAQDDQSDIAQSTGQGGLSQSSMTKNAPRYH